MEDIKALPAVVDNREEEEAAVAASAAPITVWTPLPFSEASREEGEGLEELERDAHLIAEGEVVSDAVEG